jgi:excisionase family DNA binding protein
MSSKLISIADAAQRLGVSRITGYRWAEAGSLPSIKLGARRLVPEEAIERLVAQALAGEAR